MSKDHRVVQLDIVRPNKLCILEIVLKERFLGAYSLLLVLRCICPVAVVKVDCEPVLWNWNVLNLGIFRVAVDRAMRERPRLPGRVGNGTIAKFQDETCISNTRVGVLHARFGIGIVFCHYSDRHGIARQQINRHHVVGDELDRVDCGQLAIDIQNKRVVSVHVGFYRVDQFRLANFILRSLHGRVLCPCQWCKHRHGQHRDDYK